VLFTAVDPESKYKAKNFIDTVVQRGSDMTAGWAHGALQAKGMLLSGFGAISALVMIVVVAIGIALGRAYARRERSAPAAPAKPAG
jgi:AAA family ATP:ADP antiporter